MYDWTCEDVLMLLGIRYNPAKAENVVDCPFCGGKRFGINIKKGTGHCFQCAQSADSASYYAAVTGLSLNEARNQIREKLNLTNASIGLLPERKVYKEPEQEEIAPVEVRDATYRAFLRELVLNQKNFDHLLARGFSAIDIEAKGYKTYPSASEISFEDLCRRLQSKGCRLEGVPGFFKNKNNEWTFPRYTQGIIIPQINVHNQIEGFQIRKDDDLRRENDGELEAKCVWFSSNGKWHGAAAKTSVHIATDFFFNKDKGQYEPILHGNTVTLTEGGMKADLVNALLDSKVSVISVPGVNAIKALSSTLNDLKGYGLKKVNIAFDMDYLTNPNVKNAMKKVEEIIKDAGLEQENIMNWQFKQVSSSGEEFYLKGIDDFLAYAYKKVVPVVKKL